MLCAFVSRHECVYQETKGLRMETLDADGQPKRLSGHRWIRSRFFRAPNRRFHARDFGPETVPKVFRDRWFGVWIDTEGHYDTVPDFNRDPWEAPWKEIEIEGGKAHGEFVNRDISSSQTQILAVFLGLDKLEDLATSTNPKFKEWLAQELWALHERAPGGLLADGYSGPGDERLVEFIKAHW